MLRYAASVLRRDRELLRHPLQQHGTLRLHCTDAARQRRLAVVRASHDARLTHLVVVEIARCGPEVVVPLMTDL